MRLNKNVIIAILLLSVFAVGTLSFVDTVEAAKWKKFDSGTYNEKNPDLGYKKKTSYIAYNKGSNDIKADFYGYRTSNNKKDKLVTFYFNKSGNKLKFYYTDSKGKKSKQEYYTYTGSTKQFYNSFIKEMKK